MYCEKFSREKDKGWWNGVDLKGERKIIKTIISLKISHKMWRKNIWVRLLWNVEKFFNNWQKMKSSKTPENSRKVKNHFHISAHMHSLSMRRWYADERKSLMKRNDSRNICRRHSSLSSHKGHWISKIVI
jgi:hypothetical protein